MPRCAVPIPPWSSSWAPIAATARCGLRGRSERKGVFGRTRRSQRRQRPQIWAHAGVADRVTCVVGTIGDGGRTLDGLADQHGFTSGALDFVFLDHDKDAYLNDLQSILDRAGCTRGSELLGQSFVTTTQNLHAGHVARAARSVAGAHPRLDSASRRKSPHFVPK